MPFGSPLLEGDLERVIRKFSLIAAGINLLLGAAFLRAVFTALSPGPSRVKIRSESSDSSHWLFRLLLPIVITLAAAWLWLPRMSQSLWGDELWSFRESTAGRYVRDFSETESLRTNTPLYWEQLSWKQTVGRYLTTNHHFLFAISSRATTELSDHGLESSSWNINEIGFRLSPYICGLLGILAWARLLKGIPLAGVLLAAVLALHPWYFRYSTEGRGYGLLLLLVPCILLAMQAAAAQNRRRSWFLLGILQFLAIYAWPGVVFTLLGLQIGLGIWIWRRNKAQAPSDLHNRWLLANLLTIMLAIQALLPCIPQVFGYLQGEVPRWTLDGRWFGDLLARFTLGVDVNDAMDYSQRNPFYVTMQSMLRNAPILTVGTGGAFLTALLVGGRVWMGRVELAVVIVGGAFGAALGLCLLAMIGKIYLYSWYFVHLTPLWVALAALGVCSMATWLGHRLPNRRPAAARLVHVVVCGGFLLAYAATVFPQFRAQRSQSLDPRRESVALTRGDAPFEDPSHLKLITAHCSQHAMNYDPHGFLVKKADSKRTSEDGPGLVQLMRLADTSDSTLLVNQGGLDGFADRYPGIAKLLAQPDLFEKTHEVHGLEPQFERHIYRYKGGMFDFLKGL